MGKGLETDGWGWELCHWLPRAVSLTELHLGNAGTDVESLWLWLCHSLPREHGRHSYLLRVCFLFSDTRGQ